MWQYTQVNGKLCRNDTSVGVGYSGIGAGLNSRLHEQDEGVGPIPRGLWNIGRFFDDIGGKGPIVAHLTPVTGTDTFGRSGFMIHGDNAAANHTASHGCIILSRALRELIMASSDRTLSVV